jgi:hypothetical protein
MMPLIFFQFSRSDFFKPNFSSPYPSRGSFV